jgi:hypothetical protein
MTRRALPFLLGLAPVIGTAACNVVLGLDKFVDGICTPGETTSKGCTYSGPPGTAGVGICTAPYRVCKDDGQGWSECQGEVTPKPAEDCSTSVDDDCNGETNEASAGCCAQGDSQACYDPAVSMDMKDVGVCGPGTQACGKDGTFSEPCTGAGKPQQETCASTNDEDCDGRECVEWTQLYGDASDQLVDDFTIDMAGNMYVVGTLYGTLTVNGTVLSANGSGDCYLLKLDPSGKAVWAVSFGDSGSQEFSAVAVDSQGNVFVGGRSLYSAISIGGPMLAPGLFVAKYGPDGKHVWSKGLTTTAGCVGSDSSLKSLAVTPKDDLVVGGYYCGTIDFGDGAVTSKGRDAFVAKLRGTDGSGKMADTGWGKAFGDAMLQSVDRVAVDAAGNVFVASSFQGAMDFGEGQVTSNDAYDALLIKFTPSGNPIWYQGIDGMGNQEVSGLALDATGGAIVTGTYDTSIDFYGVSMPAGDTGTHGFIVRYGGDKSYGWSKTLSTGLVTPSVGATGDIMLSGLFAGSVDLGDGPLQAAGSGFEMFLVKLSSSGTVKWKRRFGDTTTIFDLYSKVVALPSGESVIGGMVSTPVDFGGGTVSSAGGLDILVAKFGL